MSAVTDEIDKLTTEAENKSFKICERCGKPGKLRDTGWLKTLCNMCDKED